MIYYISWIFDGFNEKHDVESSRMYINGKGSSLTGLVL